MAVLLFAWIPPTAAQIKPPAVPEQPTLKVPAIKPPAERVPPSLKVPAIKPPAERATSIIIPRQNCGTFHTGWVNDPEADVNPCPKACERGERLWVSDRKSGDKTLYDGVYRCYLPELVVAQPPGALAESGAPPRQNCGTVWAARQSEPHTDANPCPERCERGELSDVKRGLSDGKAYYEMNYRCYVAVPQTKLPASSTAGSGTNQGPSTEKGVQPAEQAVTLTTAPLRMTGKRIPTAPVAAPAEQPVTLTSAPLRMTGKRIPTAPLVAPKAKDVLVPR